MQAAIGDRLCIRGNAVGTPDKIGETLLVASGVGLAAHLTSVVARKSFQKTNPDEPTQDSGNKE